MAHMTNIRRMMRSLERMFQASPLKAGLVFSLLVVPIAHSATVLAQPSGGSESPKITETASKADQNLRSIARVNPSSLAMEIALPLMTYPGRNGNSMPISFSYSSKLWRMEAGLTWWYPRPFSGQKMYVTDVTGMFSERASAGWTSSLMPPRLDETLDLYNQYGKPFNFTQDYLSLQQSYEQNLNSLVDKGSDSLFEFCGNGCISETRLCIYFDGELFGCSEWECVGYTSQICPTQFPGAPTEAESPTYDKMHYVKRVRITMPDGSTHEFRKSDAVFGYCSGQNNPNNGPNCEQEGEDHTGTFLAVDGSGMKLVRPAAHEPDQRTILYLPNGSRYFFPPNPQGTQGLYASDYVDIDGNKTSFTQITHDEITKLKWTDTMGREIIDPMPHNWNNQKLALGTFPVKLPGLNNQPHTHNMKWLPLKPTGCEDSTNSSCGITDDGVVPGALEDQSEKLYYTAPKLCDGNLTVGLPAGEILFPDTEVGLRVCNPIIGENQDGNPTAVPVRFNPVVLAEMTLPNGKSFKFKYNRYGEITRIDYPTGSYEKFRYEPILPMNGEFAPVFNQANRGVVERWVYAAGDSLEQHWTYSADAEGGQPPNQTGGRYKITTIASSQNNPNETGIKTERYLFLPTEPRPVGRYGNFGFEDPRSGMPVEEIVKDRLGNIRSRTLTEYIAAPRRDGDDVRAKRDPRPSRSVSIIFEGAKALATLSVTEYDENGSADPEHFSHLNVKRKKEYHYKPLDLNTAKTASLETIALMFSDETLLVSVSESDYQYDSNYKARGIASLPTESRVLNPANTSEVLVRTKTIFDEPSYLVPNSGVLIGNLAATWIDPTNDQSIPVGSRTLRGKPTTSKTWQEETSSWIQTHTQYDQYGNVRKAWDESGNPGKFVETQYSAAYACAYATLTIRPAPDPSNTHGTDHPSQSSTTYDYMTGLSLTSTDDFGQTVKTEYNDPLLRPTRVLGVNVTVPISETIYDDHNLTVKVRKQIDENNWEEATTYSDSMGRTIMTKAKDSQGDVVVRTKYDFMGHATAVSNPHRVNISGKPTETVYWSRTSYDDLGRVVQAFAPALESATGDSLGTTNYDLVVAGDSIGTVVETTDAAGRKSRTITNALEQLIRVDEPSSANTLDPLPEPGASPTPTPEPSPTPPCAANCLNNLVNAPYPMRSTYYKYDALGNMVMVVQGAQKRYFKYDSFGRLIRVRQPEQEINASLNLADDYNVAGEWSAGFVYDILGNLKRTTDANGVNIINEYDKANRIVRRCYTKPSVVTTATECNQISGSDLSEDTPTIETFYDGKGLSQIQSPNYAKGKLTKVTSSISETRYTLFDNLGRLLQSEQITDGRTYTSKYEYNLSGSLTQLTYPSGRTVRSAYDSDGDLAMIQSRVASTALLKTYASDFAYTPTGKIDQIKLGNGRWETAKFNPRQQITELALGISLNDASLWKINYVYGELEGDGITVNQTKNTGNIAKQTISFSGLMQPFVQTYKYDSLRRLIEAREINSNQQIWKQNFGYDRYGNRTEFSQVIGQYQLPINNFTHPTIDPLTNRFVRDQGYTYDKNGNLTVDATNRRFSFNGENKQTEVRDAYGALVGKYYYDGEGRRVKKQVFYLHNGQPSEEIIFVYDGMGKLVAEYSNQSPTTNATTKYTATDILGSPRVLTDAAGNVISRRDFMPFGEELNPDSNYRTLDLKYGASDTVRQKFTGYQRDEETGLDFAEARMYENRHARFTAVDPLLASGKSANPQTFNRYVYVINNPVIFTDPTGMQVAHDPDEDEVIATVWCPAYDSLSYPEMPTLPSWFERTYNYGGRSVTVRSPMTPKSDSVLTRKPRTSENPTIRRFLRGFTGGLGEINEGVRNGIDNVVIDATNFAILTNPAAPLINPPLIPRRKYSSERSAKFGLGVEFTALLAPTPIKFGAFSKAPVLSIAPEAASRTTSFAIIGKMPNTQYYQGLEEADVLFTRNWTVQRNDAWVTNVVNQRKPVLMISPRNARTLLDPKYGESIFGREIRLFREAGYTQWGDWLVPPLR